MRYRQIQKRHALYLCLIFVFIQLAAIIGYFNIHTVYAQETGKVNASLVNVRSGPGTSYDVLLTPQGNKVQLNEGHSVNILGTDTASDGAAWYHVSFTYNDTYYEGYIHSTYITVDIVVDYTPDADFESYLNEQGFPESYKESLRQLHARYPEWVFVADKLDYDWNTVVTNESEIGRSLVPSSSISSWKSTAQNAYNAETGTWYGLDGASWVAASNEIVAYCLDPRNFLDSEHIFMFEVLSYNATAHTEEGIQKIIASTYMASTGTIGDGTRIYDYNGSDISYAQALAAIAAQTGVSPYHLASRIIQETGSDGSSASISGTHSVCPGYYNYYNLKAYAHDGRDAVTNGLIWAQSQGWNTRYMALLGGASSIASGYINVGQDTLYYEKFDFVGTPYTHQYMTNVLAPKSESVNVAKGYSEEMRASSIVFKIPIYNNMPETAVAIPTGTGSPNNALSDLSIEGYSLTPTFNRLVTSYDVIVPDSVTEVQINATPQDASATVSGGGTVSLQSGTNVFHVNITAANGNVNTYTINIYRNEGGMNGTIPTPSGDASFTMDYTVDSEKGYMSAVGVGSTVVNVIDNITFNNCNALILFEDGTINSGVVQTGNILVITDDNGNEVCRYTIVVYGDVNGDGEVSSMDMLYVKRHILGVSELTGPYLEAADANRAGDGVTSLDMLYLKRHILGTAYISQ